MKKKVFSYLVLPLLAMLCATFNSSANGPCDEPDSDDDGGSSSNGAYSTDPNEMSGSLGFGTERYVVPGEWLDYIVYFENQSTATASAQEIRVTNPMSEFLDWTTFELGEIVFKNQTEMGLAGKKAGTIEVQQTGTTHFVKTTFSLNQTTGVAEWYMRVVDKTTADGWPAETTEGFLPPNDSTGQGEGHLAYRVKVKSNVPMGTIIRNAASIVFDYNSAIVTDPDWWNKVYTATPDKVATGEYNSDAGTLSWGESDTAASYDLYLWQTGTERPGSPTASVTDSTWSLPDDLALGSYQWQVVARNPNGTKESEVWTFATGEPPTITIQPVNVSVFESLNATFTVGATSTLEPMTYQWFLNGTAIEGAIAATYTVSNVQTVHAGNYSVQVSNVVGSVMSETAALTLKEKVAQTITFDALAERTYGDEAFSLEATASSGLPVSYTITPEDNGIVTLDENNVISIVSAGTVIITASQPGGLTGAEGSEIFYAPAENVIQELVVNKATPVITWLAPETITYGTELSDAQLNATANVEGSFVYDPAVGAKLNAGIQKLSVTFAPKDADNYNSVSAVVGIVVLKAEPVITWSVPVAITYGTELSDAQLNATANVEGSFVYDPSVGTKLSAGTYSLNVIFTPKDNDNYTDAKASVKLVVKHAPPTITIQPQDVTVIVGQDATFTVGATSTLEPMTYQWYYLNGEARNPIAGATGTRYSITNAQLTDAGFYCVEVTNPSGTTVSQTVELGVKRGLTIMRQSLQVNAQVGKEAKLFVLAEGHLSEEVPALQYQWYRRVSKGEKIQLTPGQIADLEPDSSRYLYTNDVGEIFCKYNVDGILTLNNETKSVLSLNPSVLGDTSKYYVTIHDALGFVTSQNISVRIYEQQPMLMDLSMVRSTTGETVVLQATPKSEEPLTYQWLYNGQLLSGQTSTAYSIANVKKIHAGLYELQISNPVGLVELNRIYLWVDGFIPKSEPPMVGDEVITFELNSKDTVTMLYSLDLQDWKSVPMTTKDGVGTIQRSNLPVSDKIYFRPVYEVNP